MIGGTTFSGFVITYNEEDNIRECLESMKWADEIVVVDSLSTDRTVEIASEYTDQIIEREFAGHVDQTEYARSLCTQDWVLWLDADERLTAEAYEEVREEFSAPDGPGCAGFSFPRKTWFMDRWITHSGWYPEYRLRLFRADGARIVGDEPHPSVELPGEECRLAGEILHYSYPGGFVDMVHRSAKYAELAAFARRERGYRFSWFRAFTRPPLDALKHYVLKRGFLDGTPGFVIALASGYYRFIREMKLWELENGRDPEPFEPPAIIEPEQTDESC